MGYIKPSEDEVRKVRLRVAYLDDGRCHVVDDEGCRCLCRPHGHKGGHDFPYTPWFDARPAQRWA